MPVMLVNCSKKEHYKRNTSWPNKILFIYINLCKIVPCLFSSVIFQDTLEEEILYLYNSSNMYNSSCLYNSSYLYLDNSWIK